MSTLDNLVRLRRRQVDERRRHVAELEGLAEKLRAESGRLADERAIDHGAAGDSFLARHVYPGYIRRSLERQRTLEQSLAAVEAQTAQARDALAEAAQELQRYEVALASRERLRLNAAARRERIATDVVSLANYRRASGR